MCLVFKLKEWREGEEERRGEEREGVGRGEEDVGKEKRKRKEKLRGERSRAEVGRRRRGEKSNVPKEEAKERNLLVPQTYKRSPSARRKSLYFEPAVGALLVPQSEKEIIFCLCRLPGHQLY